VGLNNIENYNRKLAETLRVHLKNNGFKVLDIGKNLSSIVTFCGPDNDLENIQKILRENNVFFSASYKHSALIDFTDKKVDGAVRLSPHYFNTIEEVEKVSEVLRKRLL
jgi:selenocysteine lyase/cysteine desulfurase